MNNKVVLLLFSVFLIAAVATPANACSVLYYIDRSSGKIYVVNNEDYWYNTKAYIQIQPATKGNFARLWYGWDNFAQGGINEKGLFFDGAVTPEHAIPEGYSGPSGNLGDKILANCSSVEEAIRYLEESRIALNNAHMMFGDKNGNAVIVEWINGKREIVRIQENYLIMTNFLHTDPEAGAYPCYRYNSIESRIRELPSDSTLNLMKVGNLVGGAVQAPVEIEDGKTGGTLYTTFINISDMEFVLAYKLSSNNLTKLNLNEEFQKSKKRKIKLN